MITKVMIAGGGTLGSQVAWQTAFKGFDVKGLLGGKTARDIFRGLIPKVCTPIF